MSDNQAQTQTQNPPQNQTNTPEQTQTQNQNPPQNPPQQTTVKPEDLINAVQGMPEKIVNALREAGIGQQPQQTNPPQNQQNQQQTNPPDQQGQSKSFADWWFGN